MSTLHSEDDWDGYENDNISSHDDVAPLTTARAEPANLSPIDAHTESPKYAEEDALCNPIWTLQALIFKVHELIESGLDPGNASHKHLIATQKLMATSISARNYKEYVELLLVYINSPSLRSTLGLTEIANLDDLSQALQTASLASEAGFACSAQEPDFDFNGEQMEPYDERAVTGALRPFVERLTATKGAQVLLVGVVISIMGLRILESPGDNKRRFQWLDRTALVALRVHYQSSGQTFRRSYLPMMTWMQNRLRTGDMTRRECMWNTRKFLTRIHSFDMANLLVIRALEQKRLPDEIVLMIRDKFCSFNDVKKASLWESRRCPWRATSYDCACGDCDAFDNSTPRGSDYGYYRSVKQKIDDARGTRELTPSERYTLNRLSNGLYEQEIEELHRNEKTKGIDNSPICCCDSNSGIQSSEDEADETQD